MNPRVRRALAILITAVVCVGVVACGDDSAPVKTTIPAQDFSDPQAGIAFRSPAGTRIGAGEEEQVAVLRRGKSTFVVSRFKRPGENLPNSAKEYERAARVLPREYAERDGKRSSEFDYSAQTAEIADHDAVVVRVVGYGKTAEHVHFYEHGAEIVVDMVAPTSDLKAAQVALFDPVLASLKITKPRN